MRLTYTELHKAAFAAAIERRSSTFNVGEARKPFDTEVYNYILENVVTRLGVLELENKTLRNSIAELESKTPSKSKKLELTPVELPQ